MTERDPRLLRPCSASRGAASAAAPPVPLHASASSGAPSAAVAHLACPSIARLPFEQRVAS